MNEAANDLKRRTKQFALDVIRLVRALPGTDEARTIGRQLLRSATGTAANYRSACRARSPAEVISRIAVALEEADESCLWLEMLREAGISANSRDLEREANELSAILAASRITAQANMNRARH